MPQFDSGAAEPIGRFSEGLLLRLLHPWRTPQTRHRRGSNLGSQIHGKAQVVPAPRVESYATTPIGSPQWISS